MVCHTRVEMVGYRQVGRIKTWSHVKIPKIHYNKFQTNKHAEQGGVCVTAVSIPFLNDC